MRKDREALGNLECFWNRSQRITDCNFYRHTVNVIGTFTYLTDVITSIVCTILKIRNLLLNKIHHKNTPTLSYTTVL